MKSNININSNEWCDLVFDKKNKSYGAYNLRQSSGRRHIAAFLVVVGLVSVISVLPSIINSVKASNNKTEIEGIKDEYIMKQVEMERPIVEVPQVEPPKTIKVLKTISYAPPTITRDELVTDEDALKPTETVINSKDAIGVFDVPDGSSDPDAIPIEVAPPIVEEAPQKPRTFEIVEIMPQFPGGEKEMYQYISKNLKYPVTAQEINAQGKVIIRFVVGANGEIKDAQILRGFDPACDKEALRVVNSMPKWIPGKQNGNNVQVYFTLPITFRLS